jgi:hypothetical protein
LLIVQFWVVNEVAVFLKFLAVIASEDDGCFVFGIGRLERLQEPPDTGVDLAGRCLIEGTEIRKRALTHIPTQSGPSVGLKQSRGPTKSSDTSLMYRGAGMYGVCVSIW